MPKRALTEAELQAMREHCGSKRDLAIFEFLRSTGCRVHEMLFALISDVDIKNKRVFLRKTKAKPQWGRVRKAETMAKLRALVKSGKVGGVEKVVDEIVHDGRVFKGSVVVQRYSFFDRQAAGTVAAYIEERRSEGAKDEDLLFTIDRGAKSGMVRRIVKGLAKNAKIPDWQAISPHSLRHTRSTRLTSKGYPTKYIKDALGWSQKSRTYETTYEHSDVDAMQALHDKVMGGEEE